MYTLIIIGYTKGEPQMLGKTQMQEIQDLKLRGYTKAEIMAYYEQLGMKPPHSLKVLRHGCRPG